MTDQPTWRTVYATDYSALFVDETGVYDPELQIAQEYEDEDGDQRWQVYRFPLDRLWTVDDPESDLRPYLVTVDPKRTDLPHPITNYVPWFAKYLHSVAQSVGSSVADLQSALTCDDPGVLIGLTPHASMASIDV